MDPYGDEDTANRRKIGWAIPIILLLVAAPAVVLLVQGSGGDAPSAPDRAASTGAGPGASDGAGTQTTTDCPAFDRSPTELPVDAPDAEWRTKGPFTYPVSVQTGGTSVNGPARPAFPGTDTCYAHTPIGAAFAAASASVEVLVAESAVPYLQTRVVGGRRDELLGKVSQLTPGDFSFGDITFRVTAFKIVDYTPDRVLVEIVTQGQNQDGISSTKAAVMELVWRDGDWKVVLGSDAAGTRDVTDAAAEGFLAW